MILFRRNARRFGQPRRAGGRKCLQGANRSDGRLTAPQNVKLKCSFGGDDVSAGWTPLPQRLRARCGAVLWRSSLAPGCRCDIALPPLDQHRWRDTLYDLFGKPCCNKSDWLVFSCEAIARDFSVANSIFPTTSAPTCPSAQTKRFGSAELCARELEGRG